MESGSAWTATQRDDLRDAARTYVAELGQCHQWFVEAITEAGRAVVAEHGELAGVVAQQNRLARRFLDAQRSVIRLWAEVDGEAARIVEEAELDSHALASDPAAQPAEHRRESWAAHPSLGDRAEVGGGGVTNLHPPARPGRAVAARSAIDVELGEFLDSWWRAETEAGASMLDDARAFASMRVQLARSEAAGSDGEETPATDEPDVEADSGSVEHPDGAGHDDARSWVTRLGDLVDRGDPRQLIRLVDEMLAELAMLEAAGDIAPDEVTGDAVVAAGTADVDRLGANPAHGAESADAFDRFWGSARPHDQGGFTSPVAYAAAPLVAIFCLLAVVLTWMG